MKWMLVVLTVGLLVAADAPKKDDAGNKSQGKLDGTWTLTDVEAGANAPKPPADKIKDTKITFKGDTATLTDNGKDKPAKFALDAGKTPHEIDITPSEGPLKGKTMKGIYTLEGDTLKVAFARDDEKRPTELAAKGEGKDAVMVMTFKREKK